MMRFKELYFINTGSSFDTVGNDLNWENVSDCPMRFYYLLGWFHKHNWNVNWVITPNKVKIQGIDFLLYFYVGHVTVKGKDIEKFRLVSDKKSLSL